MRAQFVRGKDPKNTLRIGIEAILWNANLDEGVPEEVEYLYDDMNRADDELYELIKHSMNLGEIIREEEDNKTLYKTELGLILKHEGDYGSGYFCHISDLPEIEKRLGRKIITE